MRESASTIDRRTFLKLSTGSALLLSGGALTATLAGCASATPPAAGYRFLREADVVLFRALAPPVLDTLLPVADRARHLDTLTHLIDDTGVSLLAPTQKALRQLFDLLNTGLTRRLAAGVGQPWDQASPEEITAFLARWQASSIGLFNAGYRALTKFIIGAWAGTPEGLKALGYPGPWKPMFDAVNAPEPAPANAAAVAAGA
jgi:hypothetical protein